ncbi:MAG: hypothetical protein WBM48_17325, partial [Polyangiales bacterium]
MSSSETLGPPFPISVLTRVADPVRHRLLPIDAERVMRLAERINGLDDYGGGDMLERLEETMECVLQV